jgi:thioredoxin reductase (NADPH)
LGAEIIVTRQALGIDAATRTIALDGGDSIQARSIILAMGVDWRRLDVPGLAALTGKGVFYGASRSDAATTQNRDVHLVGGGNSAGQAALFFASHASSVTLIVRGGDIADSMSAYLVEQIRAKANIAVMTGVEIRAVYGGESLTGIDIADRESGAMRQVASGGLFLFIGAEADTGWLPAEVARNERGYVLTGGEVVRTGRWALPRDPYLVETSAPGIFACGDVRLSPVKRVAAAVGEGSMAIAFVHQYLAGEAGQG